MDISKFIKENNSPYSDTLNTQIEKVEELVKNNIISPKLASSIIYYLVRKDVSKLIKNNLENILYTKGKRDQWFVLNYSHKHTNYI